MDRHCFGIVDFASTGNRPLPPIGILVCCTLLLRFPSACGRTEINLYMADQKQTGIVPVCGCVVLSCWLGLNHDSVKAKSALVSFSITWQRTNICVYLEVFPYRKCSTLSLAL